MMTNLVAVGFAAGFSVALVGVLIGDWIRRAPWGGRTPSRSEQEVKP